MKFQTAMKKIHDLAYGRKKIQIGVQVIEPVRVMIHDLHEKHGLPERKIIEIAIMMLWDVAGGDKKIEADEGEHLLAEENRKMFKSYVDRA